MTEYRDVTGRKRAEEELRWSEERNRAILGAYPDLVFRMSRDGEYLDFQANDDDKLYVSREEIVGNNILDTLPPEVAGDAFRRLARAFETGGMQVYEYRLSVPAGPRDFEARFVPTGDEEALCIIRDVTERKRVEAALQESEERFRTLFECSVDTLIIHDEEGRILDCNSEACRTLGYTREELLSLRVGDIATGLLSGEERKEREERGGTLWQRIVRGDPDTFGVVHYGEHRRKDGTTFPIEVHVGGVNYGERRLILASVRDITERREFEKRLRENEQRYRSLFEHNPDAVYSLDLEGNFLSANAACETLTGYPVEELLRMSFVPLVAPEELERTLRMFERAVRGEPRNYENAIIHRDGHRVELNATKLPIIIDDEIVGVYGIAKDITARRRAEESLRASEERYRTVIERATDGIYIYDFRTKRILESNTALQNMLGYTSEEISGLTIYDLIANSRESIDLNTPRISEGRSVFLGERRYRHKDGSLRDVESSVTLIPYGDEVEGACCIVHDITERKALERQLSHQAFHDPLTGLPNRLLLTEHIEHALARARRRKNRIAVLFMDLDNFKDVNDSLGHGAGDQLLISVAEVLRKTVRPEDTVARFGGDEITVLLEEVTDTRDAVRVAERIEEALRAPITIAGHELFVGVSIGIATSLSGRDRPEKLISQADMAMYRAKRAGRARHEVFARGMETMPLERLQLSNDLRRAVEQDEMKVCYQSKVHLGTDLQQQLRSSGNPAIVRASGAVRTGEIVGMEALVRWEHPERGVVYPSEFISAAEETGLILPIGHRVLEEACRQAKTWQADNPPLVMCVNLSARQFQHPALAQDITRVLRETGLDPHCLQLEITESVLMKEAGSTMSILKELRKLGVSLAIDDFGTGYSSLSYLKHFPADYLKIDHSFVAGVGEDPENAAIVSGIITLAHTLGMQVIAEGVETADQAARLRRMGCDLAQGNYFSEPLPGEAAGELLARNRLSAAFGATP